MGVLGMTLKGLYGGCMGYEKGFGICGIDGDFDGFSVDGSGYGDYLGFGYGKGSGNGFGIGNGSGDGDGAGTGYGTGDGARSGYSRIGDEYGV